MGTLGGHLIPGTFFIMFGVWWGFITAIRYTKSKTKSPFKKGAHLGYQSSTTMPCICLPCNRLKRAPIESYMKIVLVGIALFLEAYTGFYRYDAHVPIPGAVSPNLAAMSTKAAVVPLTKAMQHDHGEHEHMHDHGGESAAAAPQHSDLPFRIVKKWDIISGNKQHITMYSAFIVGAIVEIFVHYGYDLPERLDFVCGAMAFFIEGFLFNSHLHGKAIIEQYVHVLLVWAIAGCFVFSVLEYHNPNQIMYTYGRSLFTILQGTWFFQVGFMLYPPSDFFWEWDLNDHGSVMLIAVAFCWHMILIFVGLLAQLWLVKFLQKMPFGRFNCDEIIYIDNLNLNHDSKQQEYKFDSKGNRVADDSETRFLTVHSDEEDDNGLDEKVIFSKK